MKLKEKISHMEKFINSLEKVLSYIYSALITINIVLMVICPLVIVIYIVLRFFGVGLLFVEEYTQYWLVFLCYSTFAYAFREGAMLKVEIFTKNIKGTSRKILETIRDLIIGYVLIYLFQRVLAWFIYGFKLKAVSAYPSNSLLWPFYTFPVIGFALLIIEILIKTYKDIKKFLPQKGDL